MTRAKLTCMEVTPVNEYGQQVTFSACYDTANVPEDNSFSKYTPSASFVMSVTNPDLYGKFEAGKAYYFDITPCEQRQAARMEPQNPPIILGKNPVA